MPWRSWAGGGASAGRHLDDATGQVHKVGFWAAAGSRSPLHVRSPRQPGTWACESLYVSGRLWSRRHSLQAMRIHQWWSVGGCVKAARAPPSTTARPSTLVQLGDTKRRAWDRRTRITTGLGGAVKPVTHRHGPADVIGGVLSARLWARLTGRGGMQKRRFSLSTAPWH